MKWSGLTVAPEGTHHLNKIGQPAYAERFDEVLKFHEPGLAPVLRRGEAWHIHPDAKAAYERRFSRTFGFYEGYAAVIAPDGWHHITPEGKDAYSERYMWCGNFQGERCTVRQTDGRYLHITKEGTQCYAERWHYAGDYRDGIAVIQADNGHSTHIDKQGRFVHDRWFVDLDVFHKGYARARDNDGWMHVDEQGKPVYTRRFAAVEPFYNGQARVELLNGSVEVIDETGRRIVDVRPALRSDFAALSGDMVGFWRTQTIAVAVRLGVIEELPATENQVAEKCALGPDGTRRLLRALAELQLIRNKNGLWDVTPRGTYLRKNDPWTLADAASEYAGPFSDLWKSLPEALRKGSKWKAPDVFGDVAADKTRCEGHHRMLRSYARHDYPEVEKALALQGDEHIIDAGGGLGTLAGMLMEAFPKLKVTVLDRPEVIKQGEQEAAPGNGIYWHAADIFEPWGIQADAVVLSRVMHDWDDDKALKILERARASMKQGARVFIIEMLIEDGNVSGALCDLHLLVATGGRERSSVEFQRLLKATGFKWVDVKLMAALPSIVIGEAI